jgi:Ca2+-binding EF-hand superfamily protein
MTDLNYTVSETVYRRYGEIIEISYEYEETKQEQIVENMQTKQERRARNYQASIKRTEYERLAGKIQYQRNVLPFDIFVAVIRPFMMGTYAVEEIREAFHLLDRNSSNTIDLDELSAFLPVLHPNITKETLLHCMNKVAEHDDQQINFDEFKQMILKGIGRDIVCGHV